MVALFARVENRLSLRRRDPSARFPQVTPRRERFRAGHHWRNAGASHKRGGASRVALVVETDFDGANQIESLLNDVDRALERLRAGTYRTCQVCGTAIAVGSLVESPLLANCPAHPELS